MLRVELLPPVRQNLDSVIGRVLKVRRPGEWCGQGQAHRRAHSDERLHERRLLVNGLVCVVGVREHERAQNLHTDPPTAALANSRKMASGCTPASSASTPSGSTTS